MFMIRLPYEVGNCFKAICEWRRVYPIDNQATSGQVGMVYGKRKKGRIYVSSL
jgi:hypothetical protein